MPVVLLHPKSFAGSAWGRPRNFSTGGASGSYPDFAIIAEEVRESRGFIGAGYRKSNPDLCKNTKTPIIGGRSGPSSGRNPRRGKRTGRGQRVYSLKRKPACLSSGFAPTRAPCTDTYQHVHFSGNKPFRSSGACVVSSPVCSFGPNSLRIASRTSWNPSCRIR